MRSVMDLSLTSRLDIHSNNPLRYMITVTAVILGGRRYFFDRYFSYYQHVVSLKSGLYSVDDS